MKFDHGLVLMQAVEVSFLCQGLRVVHYPIRCITPSITLGLIIYLILRNEPRLSVSNKEDYETFVRSQILPNCPSFPSPPIRLRHACCLLCTSLAPAIVLRPMYYVLRIGLGLPMSGQSSEPRKLSSLITQIPRITRVDAPIISEFGPMQRGPSIKTLPP
jgi:hypothetical protein